MRAPTLFDADQDVQALLWQYRSDLEELGWTGHVWCPCPRCTSRSSGRLCIATTEHVFDRFLELRAMLLAPDCVPIPNITRCARRRAVAAATGAHREGRAGNSFGLPDPPVFANKEHP